MEGAAKQDQPAALSEKNKAQARPSRSFPCENLLSHDCIHPFFEVFPCFFESSCRSAKEVNEGAEEREGGKGRDGQVQLDLDGCVGELGNSRKAELDRSERRVATYGGACCIASMLNRSDPR